MLMYKNKGCYVFIKGEDVIQLVYEDEEPHFVRGHTPQRISTDLDTSPQELFEEIDPQKFFDLLEEFYGTLQK